MIGAKDAEEDEDESIVLVRRFLGHQIKVGLESVEHTLV